MENSTYLPTNGESEIMDWQIRTYSVFLGLWLKCAHSFSIAIWRKVFLYYVQLKCSRNNPFRMFLTIFSPKLNNLNRIKPPSWIARHSFISNCIAISIFPLSLRPSASRGLWLLWIVSYVFDSCSIWSRFSWYKDLVIFTKIEQFLKDGRNFILSCPGWCFQRYNR